MTTTVYVASLDLKYNVIGVGATPEAAKTAAVREYVRTNNSGYGLLVNGEGKRIRTAKAFDDYAGIRVYGPMPLPGAATEG